jgi:hypothetical protein
MSLPYNKEIYSMPQYFVSLLSAVRVTSCILLSSAAFARIPYTVHHDTLGGQCKYLVDKL